MVQHTKLLKKSIYLYLLVVGSCNHQLMVSLHVLLKQMRLIRFVSLGMYFVFSVCKERFCPSLRSFFIFIYIYFLVKSEIIKKFSLNSNNLPYEPQYCIKYILFIAIKCTLSAIRCWRLY